MIATINGVQTLCHACTNLIEDIEVMRAAGIGSLRLSPQACDMVEVAQLFRDVIDGRRDANAASGCPVRTLSGRCLSQRLRSRRAWLFLCPA